MRIISGTHKGRRLTAPKNLPVRPTTDFAKEALFNVLHNRFYFDDLSVIDLFAGTGNISYEFASRGCKHITCVDAHPGCIKFIAKTARELQFSIETVKSDAFSFLEKTGRQADIIFADPFYDLPEDRFAELVRLVFGNRLLLPDGLFIVEHFKRNTLAHLPHFSYSKKYGSSMFSFFEEE